MSGQQNNVHASGWKGFLGPLGRIVLAAVLVVAAVAAAQVVVKLLKGVLSLGGAVPALYYLVYLLASVLVAYFVYRAYVRLDLFRAGCRQTVVKEYEFSGPG